MTGSLARLDPKNVLLALLALLTAGYLVVLIVAARRQRRAGEAVRPRAGGVGTGFVANFFDTLGIGSFATTTTIFRHFRMVRDEKIPGTLNVGHAVPTITQAFIFTKLVPVAPKTLILMIAAAVLGAWLGAGVVSRWPRRRIQIGMALTLTAAAAIMLLKLLHLLPGGGDALALTGPLLVVGVVGNFVLGTLMTIGIGLYAPCMILVSLLGMRPIAAFPIMMGSCAFLMPVAGSRFVREKSYDARAAWGLLLGGVPGVLIAAFLVKSLPLTAVSWLVVIVVLYTAWGLLNAARRRLADAGAAGVAAVEAAD